jgi:ketosteroid isomerase-like protein
VRSPLDSCLIAGAIFVLSACTLGTRSSRDEVRESLAATERAFARYSLEHGVRAAFTEYFADDGINFQPGPVNTKDAFRARPPSDPKRFVLDWHPVLVEVARAGDLGFSTGPSSLIDRAAATPDVHDGIFFSVWRQDAGVWRVVIDGGIETPRAVPDAAFGGQLRAQPPAAASDATRSAAMLATLETRPPFRSATGGRSADYAALLLPDARLLIDSSLPLIGRDAVSGYLGQRTAGFEWRPIAFRVSQSADLAYSYGTVHFDRVDGRAVDAHYIHLWLTDSRGEWKLAFDVVLLPPGVESLD